MCNDCNWRAWTDDVQAMIQDIDGRYDWALKTLKGIRATVRGKKHVTDNQRRAISNIRGKVIDD